MAGRKKRFNETNVLACAARLFMAKGFDSTSTEELLEAMNINKGSFYHSFGSKRELFIKVLQFYSDQCLAQFKKQLEESDDPLATIKASFLDVAHKGTPESFRIGCFLGNTVIEQASLDEELQKIAASTLKKFENIYYEYIKQAQATNQIQTKEEPRALARHLINLWNGINLTARMYGNSNELLPVLQMNLNLIT